MTDEEKREKKRDKWRKYREENREKIRKYYEENWDKVRESQRKWREENRDKVRENDRKWRKENWEIVLRSKARQLIGLCAADEDNPELRPLIDLKAQQLKMLRIIKTKENQI